MNECCLFCDSKFGSFYMFAFITLLLLLSMVTSMNRFHRNAYSVSWPRAIETLTVFWPPFRRMVHHPNTKCWENTSNKSHNIYELQIKIKRLNWTAFQSKQQKKWMKKTERVREREKDVWESRTEIKKTNTGTNKIQDIFSKPEEEWLNPCKYE